MEGAMSENETRAAAATLGRRGGGSRSERKRESARRNLARARERRWVERQRKTCDKGV